MENIVIGVEGLVGAGKTSICKKLLEYIPNSIVLHGGNIYRAIVYKLLENKELLDSKNIDIGNFLEIFDIKIKIINRETQVYCGDNIIDDEILQSRNNSLAVSEISNVADNKSIYIYAKKIIDDLKKDYNVIFSGRDTMKIYPDLDYHFFITASLDERINRKTIQYKETENIDNLKKEIIKRDNLQINSGFYQKYENTIEIDVTNFKTVDEATKEVLKYIKIKETI